MPLQATAAIVRRPFALALALTCWLGAAPPARAEELTELPLESLLETEVVSAARFARQITDSASAVSVLTAEEIRIYGLRTFGEVLDQMRGMHITHSLDYVFLGARGIGGPMSFAGKVLLLIDGIPAVDNLYDQPYLGHDALIDTALIERIEYAPGGGSAIYGNNAFLGVINVVTKRGRDIAGLQVSASLGDWNERTVRLSGGQRLANGAEWLLSATVHQNSGLPSAEIGDLFDISTAHDHRLFFKGTYEGFSVEAMGGQRRVFTDNRPAWYYSYLDRNELVSLGYDFEPAAHWRTSLRLNGGRYAYRTSDQDTQYGYARDANSGTWWSMDGQFSFDGLEGHRIVLGARVRRDPLLRYDYLDYDGQRYVYDDRRRSVGFSGEDEVTLSPEWRVTGGLRVDKRTYSDVAWSPRAALVWQPAPEWQLKLSQGRATRFASTSERGFGTNNDVSDERVTTNELVTEYRRDSLRLLGSVYRYRVTHLYQPDEGVTHVDGRGVELEAEWQWRGFRLRGSQAWQHAEASAGPQLGYSPRTVSKLQASAPLIGETLRLSLAYRRTGGFDDATGAARPPHELVDLTLVSQKFVDKLDLRIGWRNLTNQREEALDQYYNAPPTDRRRRSAWIELTGSF
ncbi:TonB-dependent receptor plug domain-containing protein [Ideonella sp.]|uniref:TonB-dependent receptor plug domain-containing protein n=1 Tax=Ideonella sp. TaxID=1929293 RepID=UPI0035B37DD2